jgi:hypothetical protein
MPPTPQQLERIRREIAAGQRRLKYFAELEARRRQAEDAPPTDKPAA